MLNNKSTAPIVSALLTLGIASCTALVQDDSANQNSSAVQFDFGEPQGNLSEGEECTLTQGYWKNHPEDWPVDTLDIGGVTYSQKDALELLRTPPKGDVSLILGHQLIAATLNVATGAPQPSELDDANLWMAHHKDADERLPYGMKKGSGRSEAVDLADALADFNEGTTGPGHCDDGPPANGCGGAGGSSGAGGSGGPIGSSGAGGSGGPIGSSGEGGSGGPAGSGGQAIDCGGLSSCESGQCPVGYACYDGCCREFAK